MIGTSANLMGVGLGFLVPKIFISSFNEHDVYTQDQKAEFSDQVLTMLIAISITSTIIAIICVITFKEKPDTPPPQDLSIPDK